jgi:hypothetical protein
MAIRTSRDLPGTKPRKDEERDTQAALIEDAGKTEGRDRDLVHGDGGTIDLPVKPGDISKDDWLACVSRSGPDKEDSPSENGKWPSALAADFLCKGIPQADRPAEHWMVRRGIGVPHEIALPLELHDLG